MYGDNFNPELFAARLRELMDENNDTVHTLGKYVGVSGATISRYLNEIHEPKRGTIKMMCEKYGVDPVWLLGGDAPKYLDVNNLENFTETLKRIVKEKGITNYEEAEEMIKKALDMMIIAKGK